MSSPTTYPVVVDDKDLDDAALWAMIDSATASRKSLVIKHHSPSPISKSSPPAPKFQRLSGDSGEVVHDPWPYRPPRKIARICSSEESSPLALVRSVQRTTPPAKVYSSPETGKLSEAQSSPLALVRSVQRMPPAKVYSSPETGKLSEATQELSSYTEVSPRCFGRGEEEKENSLRHSLSGSFPSVSLFKEYQNAAMAILEKTDYTLISGNPYIKKTGWRKISCYFNISYEIRDKNIEFDQDRNVQRAEFVIRAYMQGGRFSDGWGSCDRREKRFQKPNHDIPSTAETRAKNKACQDLLGIGEYRPGAATQFR